MYKYLYGVLVLMFFCVPGFIHAETYNEAVFWPNQTLSKLDGQVQYFDVAWPKTNDSEKKFPLVIWLHGSGWFAPVPKVTFERTDMETLAKQGYVVVSMNYRISNLAAPTYKNLFPAPIQDVRCAVKRFRSNRYPNLPVDKDNIAVSGISAGGNMSLILAALSSKSESEISAYAVDYDSPECEYNNYSAAIQAAISVAGPPTLVENSDMLLRFPPVTYVGHHSPAQTAGGPILPSIALWFDRDESSAKEVKLVWNVSNASNCTASGDWSGNKGINDSSIENIDVDGSKTFTLTCTGPGGSTARSATAMGIHTSVNYLGVQPKDDVPLARLASPQSLFANASDSDVPPLMLIHGGEDNTVPIEARDNLIKDVLDPRSITHEVITFNGLGHDINIWKNTDQRILDFLSESLTSNEVVPVEPPVPIEPPIVPVEPPVPIEPPIVPVEPPVSFDSPVELLGYAWSPTIGWISMSCKNSDQGCSNNYKVQINTDKNLVGYAWSSNIGWIKFGGLGTPPSGGGFSGQARVEYTTDNSTNANVNTDWELQGWARACAGAAKANCTGGVHPSAGGWGGWISLGGTATNGSSYSVKIKDDAGTLDRSASSAAWGSTVVGWVDFRDVYIDLTTTPTDPDPKICTKAAAPDKCVGDNLIKYDLFCGKKTIDCSVASAASGLTADGGTCEVKGGKPQCVDKIIPTKTPVGNLVATFSATPPWVRKGDNVEFTWSITGDDTTCRVKGSDGDWYSDFKDSNDGATVSETSSKSIDLNLTVFTLWCKTAAADPLEALDTSKVNGGDPVEVNLIPGVYES